MFLQHRATALLRLLTLAMLMAILTPATPAMAQVIKVVRAGAEVGDLYLGNNLNVEVKAAQANTDYELRLVDELDNVISTKFSSSDAQGFIPLMVLWARSGVVGCDSGATPDPLLYQFQTFELAETLAGRTFRISLRILGGAEIASYSLPLVTSPKPRFYYSDGAACPRFSFDEEDPIWISGIHLPLGWETFYKHWATASPVDPNGPWPPADIRPEYPYGLNLYSSSTTAQLVELAFLSAPNEGCNYGTVEEIANPIGSFSGNGKATARLRPGQLFGSGRGGPTRGGTTLPSPNKFDMHPFGWPGGPNTDPNFNCPPCIEFP